MPKTNMDTTNKYGHHKQTGSYNLTVKMPFVKEQLQETII